MVTLDLINTVAFGGAVLFVGHGVRALIPVLARYNVPAPVIGGLLVALLVLVARLRGVELVAFDTRLQVPFMIAFFTTVGFGASVTLLKVGGPQVLLFFLLSTVLAVIQNVVGVVIALALGMHPLFGVLNGSVTLTGGPATGLAFAPVFERAGVPGAAAVAIAAAMVGIVSGGLIGGPVGTVLIERHRLRRRRGATHAGDPPLATQIVEDQLQEPQAAAPPGEDKESYTVLKALVVILVAMWIGSGVSAWFTRLGFTLPAYIGAMLVAAVVRNLDDATGMIGLSQRTIDDLGNVALSLFLVLALMTLRLWELAGLALPMVAILAVQVALIAAVCFWPLFRLMGRDYDAAVMAGGLCGFMLGTTANAMANMEALVDRYGPAPRAFLVVPMVGAFFIDFANAVIITLCVNLWS
jgi:glutamate:Na+ symporter, ESS family